MISIYSTFPNQEICKEVSKQLIQSKLVVCANIFPIISMYDWEDKMQEEEEYAVYYKTSSDKWESVKSYLTKLHPYDVPAIIKFEVVANKAYQGWIEDSFKD